jgi:hypothetical protein
MQVRSKFDGTLLRAELMLRRDSSGKRRFILLLHSRADNCVAVGRTTAAIGYELVDTTPAEQTALTLAGFCLLHASQKRIPLARLVGVLSAARQKEKQRPRRPPKSKEPMPHKGNGKNPAASLTANGKTTRRPHATPKIRNHVKGRGTAASPRPIHADVRARTGTAACTAFAR